MRAVCGVLALVERDALLDGEEHDARLAALEPQALLLAQRRGNGAVDRRAGHRADAALEGRAQRRERLDEGHRDGHLMAVLEQLARELHGALRANERALLPEAQRRGERRLRVATARGELHRLAELGPGLLVERARFAVEIDGREDAVDGGPARDVLGAAPDADGAAPAARLEEQLRGPSRSPPDRRASPIFRTRRA